MGLHGSSTTPIVLQDAKVPADNVLGEVGKGHKVALNTLNFGRFKLGGMSVGGCRAAIGDIRRLCGRAQAVRSANRDLRRDPAQSRRDDGADVRHRESRLSHGRVDRWGTPRDAEDRTAPRWRSAFEEYAVEASIAKVAGTETLDYVLDENVQIHGGNGFVKDYSAERYYRDARVNRIFEGTNEINRLLIPGMLIRRALKGELPLIAAAKQLQDELLAPSLSSRLTGDERPLDEEMRTVAAFKKIALMVVGTAMQTYGQKLNDEQEVLGYAADILIETYAAESAVLRARAATVTDRQRTALHEAAARCYVNDAAQRVEHAAAKRRSRPWPRAIPADAPGSPAPPCEEHSGQHRGAAAAACGRDRRQRTIYFRLMTQRVLLLALALAWLPACSSGPSAPDDADYATRLAAARTEKDRSCVRRPTLQCRRRSATRCCRCATFPSIPAIRRRQR